MVHGLNRAQWLSLGLEGWFTQIMNKHIFTLTYCIYSGFCKEGDVTVAVVMTFSMIAAYSQTYWISCYIYNIICGFMMCSKTEKLFMYAVKRQYKCKISFIIYFLFKSKSFIYNIFFFLARVNRIRSRPQLYVSSLFRSDESLYFERIYTYFEGIYTYFDFPFKFPPSCTLVNPLLSCGIIIFS